MTQSCERITWNLRKKNCLITLVNFSQSFEKCSIKRIQNGFYITSPMGSDSAQDISCLWSMYEDFFRNEHFTHVVIYGENHALTAGPIIAAWLSAPLIFCVRGSDFDLNIFSATKREPLLYAIKRATRICSVTKEKIIKITKINPHARPKWTPNGIDTKEWKAHASERKKAYSWRKDAVSPQKKVLGIFGKHSAGDDSAFFFDCIKASGMHQSIHILLVGNEDGSIRSYLHNHNDITYTAVDCKSKFELIPFYLACDFTIIPVLHTGLPNNLLETASLGIPVIASNAGGIRELLIEDSCGYFYTPGNEAQCQRAIIDAVKCPPKQWMKHSRSCKAALNEMYTVEMETTRYLRIFHETMLQKI